jgi:hypothetical protein
MEYRARKEMEASGVDRERAEQTIQQRDQGRLAWTRAMYGVDARDPVLYDLVVNLEVMSVASACSVVVEAANRPEFMITDEVRTRLRDFTLACRVKLALATHPASRGLDLGVTASAGVVSIAGEVPSAIMLTHASAHWEHELRTVAQGVEGVRQVVLEIQPFDAYH